MSLNKQFGKNLISIMSDSYSATQGTSRESLYKETGLESLKVSGGIEKWYFLIKYQLF